jgi:mannose-1-phosphate guanylyltransferase
MYGVIMAGGRGKRFWPVSRLDKPKQFLDLTGEGSMLWLTYRRLSEFIPKEKILVFTVSDQLSNIKSELQEIPGENIYLEPVGRNTAPSLALASAVISSRGNDEPLVCCPSDHVIENTDEFVHLTMAACEVASQSDVLVTFGIPPDRPATGYGYIETGNKIAEVNEREFFEVVNFHEKPARETAESYLEKENFFWNSGIFAWRPKVFMDGWNKFVPEASEIMNSIIEGLGSSNETRIIKDIYPDLPSISVDYAIMEKADNVVVTPADIAWNDVGSWDALFDVLPSDEEGNVSLGKTEFIRSRGNLIYNDGGFSAVIGVEDHIIVSYKGLLVVCKKGESERVGQLVEMLEKKGLEELL